MKKLTMIKIGFIVGTIIGVLLFFKVPLIVSFLTGGSVTGFYYVNKASKYTCNYCESSLKGGKFIVNGYFNYIGILRYHKMEVDLEVTCPSCSRVNELKRRFKMHKFFYNKNVDVWLDAHDKEFNEYLIEK